MAHTRMKVKHETVKQRTSATEISGIGHEEVTYPNMTAFLIDALGPSDMREGERISRSTGREERTSTRTFQEAVDLAKYGWTEGERIIADLSDRLEERVHRALPWYGMELAESGGEVDVAALLDGQRENMWDWREEGGRKPVVRVNVNGAFHWNIKTQEVRVMGAAVVSLIDALEKMGRRVEMDMFWPVTSWGNEMASLRIRIKEADDPLHLANMAFAVAHASMFRRLVFSWMERFPSGARDTYSVGGAYGRSSLQPGEVHDDEVFVDIEAACGRGVLDGYDFVMEQLRKQGIEVAE